MKTSLNGIRVLHYFESCRLKAYPDPATGGAPWTIGWGNTGPDVVPGLVITQAEADAQFSKRLSQEFEPGVAAALAHTPTQGQFDGIVCLAYNIGLGNFKSSTLLKRYNIADMTDAADQFLRWNRANGVVMLGLRRRRAAERALFTGLSGEQSIAVGAAVI